MPVPASITELSTTAASNSPARTESPITADDHMRAHASFIAQLRDSDAALTDASDATKGAAMIGYRGRTQANKNDDQVSLRDHVATVIDGSTDNSAGVSAAVSRAVSEAKRIIATAGQYALGALTFNAGRVSLSGDGYGHTGLKRLGTGNFLTFQGLSSLLFENLTVEKNNSSATDSGHCVVLVDQPNSRVRGVEVKSFGGIGTGVLAYSSDILQRRTNISFVDLVVKGDRAASSNTNGTLIENGQFCRQSGIYADGIFEYAVEYKNDTRHSLLSDIISHNSKYGIGYGQTTTDATGVSLTAASNAVLAACDIGVILGKGGRNVFSGLLIDGENSASATPGGIRTTAGSYGNVFDGVLIAGPMSEPVRWGSDRNYASISSQDSAANIVTLESGVARNVTEILHPGSRSSVMTAINDSSGGALSGSSSNPMYCHATGEYRGSLSGRWHYRHDSSGAAPLSSAKHVLEGTGDTFYGLATNGSGLAGLSVVTPSANASLSYSAASDYWQAGGAAWNARFSSSLWRPSNDNACTLGTAANRFGTVYAGTGTINTSDERAKADIQPIHDAALRAWARVQYAQYKFTDAVEAKGSGARWHFGLVAQRVKEAFEAEGLNPFEYGLLCYDEWPEDDETQAGNRYGIRYEEALALECAYLRSRLMA